MIPADLPAAVVLHQDFFLRILDADGDVTGLQRRFKQRVHMPCGHDSFPDCVNRRKTHGCATLPDITGKSTPVIYPNKM
jgi:hypothetical protein